MELAQQKADQIHDVPEEKVEVAPNRQEAVQDQIAVGEDPEKAEEKKQADPVVVVQDDIEDPSLVKEQQAKNVAAAERKLEETDKKAAKPEAGNGAYL